MAPMQGQLLQENNTKDVKVEDQLPPLDLVTVETRYENSTNSTAELIASHSL